MADFKIDLKLQLKELGKDIETLGDSIVSDLQKAVEQISKMVYNEGLRLASERNHTSYQDYINNLKYEKAGKNIYVIYLTDGSPANAYEEGWGKFDMKPGFLNSNKAKTSKDGTGKYFDVPLQINPTATSAASKKITDMRSAVASVLKDKTVEKRIKEWNKQSKGMERFGKVTVFTNTKDDKTEGLVNVKTDKSSNYFLFRRVSNKSSPTKFIHPGFEGVNIFPDLEKYAQDQIDNVIESIIGK